jgi:membrane fusion protein, heavy metal efflux system
MESSSAVPSSPTMQMAARSTPPQTGSGLVTRLIDYGVTLVAVAGFSGLLLWGHHSGWQFSRAELLGAKPDAESDDWCETHRVPESICIECHPEKAPAQASYGMCQTHGVVNCLWEHPELAQTTISPGELASWQGRAQAGLTFVDRAANGVHCSLHAKRLQLASAEVAKKCGIEEAPVAVGEMKEVLEVHGDLMYDQTRIARLSPRVSGTLWRVLKQIGDPIKNGEVLALIEAAEVGRIKGEFSQAFAQTELRTKNLEALRQGAATGAIPERDLREADTAAQEARIRLKSAQQALANLGLPISLEELKGLQGAELDRRIHFLGLPAYLADTLDPRSTPANLLPLAASQDGVIVQRQAVKGEMVDPSKVLFTLAAINPLWLMLEVHFEDVEHLRPGMPVYFRPDGAKMESLGHIAWISHEADEKTRTVKVRVDVQNADGALVVHSFGCGRVVLRDEPKTMLIPNDAVQSDGTCSVVFVKDRISQKPDALQIYHVRQVRLGGRDAFHTEILAGLLPGEVIVTKGSGVLKGELLKSKIGAGE